MKAKKKCRNNRVASDDRLGLAFTQGYICAVASLVKMHGEDTMAKDLLGGIGKVDWKNIDEYDRNILREAGLLRKT